MAYTIIDGDDARIGAKPDGMAEALGQLHAARIEPELESSRRRTADFCADHPDALHRSCLSGHLTGSAAVVDRSDASVLLIHHAKLDRWLQPGGHADGDGNLAAVALREATEETGITGLRVVIPAVDLDVHAIPERGDEPEHLHFDLRFVVLAPRGAEIRHNHEALDARWVRPGDPVIEGGELSRLVQRAIAVAADLRF